MDLNTSYLCEDQIDVLIDNYTQFCSQIESFSQSVRLESQCTETQYESKILNLPKNTDFQSAFYQFVGASHDKNTLKLDENCEQPAYSQINSQTDFEDVIKTFLTNNPYFTEENVLQTVDLETYLECNEFYITEKSSPKKQNIKPATKKPNQRFKLGPQILLIMDILSISIDPQNSGPLNAERLIYGQRFRTVFFYGRCEPLRTTYAKDIDNLSENATEKINRKYKVDDGTATITVHFTQATKTHSRALQQGVDKLKYNYELACRNGIPFLGNDHYKSDTVKCKKMLDHCDTILKVINRNMAVTKDNIQNGSKVCVIGAPFLNSRTQTIEILAYNIFEDVNENREMELKLMDLLIQTYETKLLNFKITGEPVTSKSMLT